MYRKFRNAALLCAALGIIAPLNAHAQTAFEVDFVGYAYLDAPICYPGLGCNKGATIAFRFEAGNKLQEDKTTTCVASMAGKANQAGNNCGISATGTLGPTTEPVGLGPWCGHSRGFFGGQITVKKNAPENDKVITFQGEYVSAGSLLRITGVATDSSSNQSGPFEGTANAGPDATQGESCASGADKFIVAGGISGVLL